jgi:predicted metal-dependent hydrolase
LQNISDQTGLKYNKATFKSQRTRWGSCSANKTISLNYKLLFLAPELVRYIIVHELCHTLIMNHSPKFWAMVRSFEPLADKHHGDMRDAWKKIPSWISNYKLEI